MAKTYQSIRVFESPTLERFTHVHPAGPMVVWLPIVFYFFYQSFGRFSWPTVLPLAFFGFFMWTFAEYVLHRFVFHIQPKSALGKRFQFLMHGLHHDDPRDPTRLVMPPVASLIIGAILYTVIRAGFTVAGHPEFTLAFCGGFFTGYLCYDYTHYAVHHWQLEGSFFKKVKQHHMLHHFADQQSRWGVSTSLWDHVFGTMGK